MPRRATPVEGARGPFDGGRDRAIGRHGTRRTAPRGSARPGLEMVRRARSGPGPVHPIDPWTRARSRRETDRPMSRRAFEVRFPDEDAGAYFPVKLRWPNDVVGPSCRQASRWALMRRRPTCAGARCWIGLLSLQRRKDHRTASPARRVGDVPWFLHTSAQLGYCRHRQEDRSRGSRPRSSTTLTW